MISKALLSLAFSFMAVAAHGRPANTPILDGRMGEYDAVDARASYTGGGGGFGAGNSLSTIYVTWDSNYLYVALAGGEVDNKLALLIDVDPDNGTGATTTTNWTGNGSSFISYNDVGWQAGLAPADPFGLDFMVASEGFYNNVVQVLYDGVSAPDTNNVMALFDQGNGANPVGTPVDMAVYGDATACTLNGFEARIPWSVLYGSNTGRYGTVNGGEVIPPGARLRLLANLHNNNPGSSFSASDAIPEQSLVAYNAGLLTSDVYLDINLDLDTDGFPDVDAGDVNAPWIRYSTGLAGADKLYVQFNEPVQPAEVADTNNWSVGGGVPASVSVLGTNAVLLTLTNVLPAAGTLVLVSSTNVLDEAGNGRLTTYCLQPVASGLSNALTVRFYLETASGLGINPGASNYFVNGGSFPLEFGFPPATSAPLQVSTGTVYYRDVIFPPGTPTELNYKYSGELTNTGTNNYEAVRLADFATATRKLTLNPALTSMIITDYLGAAAAPWRNPTNTTHYENLYSDARRGDAGVREKVDLLITLNLSQRNPSAIQRVLVQGSDPLRGFNFNITQPDFAGNELVGWTVGGLELFDNGSNGDETADDGIYSRLWTASVDGTDTTRVPDFPHSLVGGDFSTVPYGEFWINGRSPRSIIYKFYVLKTDNSVVESPASNLEIYLEDLAGTNVALTPFLWDNESLPMAPPTNSPTMAKPIVLAGSQVRVLFSNETNELQHGVLIATNLTQGWMDFGQRAAGSSGNWTALVNNANPGAEFYAAFAGPAAPLGRVTWSPNPVPATGAVMSFRYDQNQRALAGFRNVTWQGQYPGGGFTNNVAMTFSNQGVWWSSFTVPAHTNGFVEFLLRDGNFTTYDQPAPFVNFKAQVGGRASWSPDAGAPGGSLTVTYVPAGGPLATASVVRLYHGFDGFNGITQPDMVNVGVGSNVWTYTVAIPVNRTNVVDLLFNGVVGANTNLFDNNNGNDWHAFIQP